MGEKRNSVERELSRLELEKPLQDKTKHTSSEMCPVLRGLVDEVGTATQ